jgi:2-oxoglutarate ferredoxin oxidoreductase subunit beta
MTSGQMAPTTLINQVTTTSPFGRKPEVHGFPIKVCEMLSTLEGAVFVERVSTHDVKNIMNAKKAIKKAIQVQRANLGFGIVEILSSCPTNWGMNPVDALGWIKDKMVPFYPLGNFKGKDLEV